MIHSIAERYKRLQDDEQTQTYEQHFIYTIVGLNLYMLFKIVLSFNY